MHRNCEVTIKYHMVDFLALKRNSSASVTLIYKKMFTDIKTTYIQSYFKTNYLRNFMHNKELKN